MKLFKLALLLLSFAVSHAQDKIYLDKKQKELPSAENAVLYKTLENDAGSIRETIYTMEGTLKQVNRYSDYREKVKSGTQQWYDQDGKLAVTEEFQNGKRHGKTVSYWAPGILKSEETFDRGEFVSGKVYDKSGKEMPFVQHTETKPEYTGGLPALYSYIAANFNNKTGESGKIIVSFVVEKDGSVVDAVIDQGISESLNQEALRVVRSMKGWKPGMQDNKPVRCMYHLPIRLQ